MSGVGLVYVASQCKYVFIYIWGAKAGAEAGTYFGAEAGAEADVEAEAAVRGSAAVRVPQSGVRAAAPAGSALCASYGFWLARPIFDRLKRRNCLLANFNCSLRDMVSLVITI